MGWGGGRRVVKGKDRRSRAPLSPPSSWDLCPRQYLSGDNSAFFFFTRPSPHRRLCHCLGLCSSKEHTRTHFVTRTAVERASCGVHNLLHTGSPPPPTPPVPNKPAVSVDVKQHSASQCPTPLNIYCSGDG